MCIRDRKRWAILDVMIIALGFLFRIHAGGAMANVPISMWLEILTFLLALFIAFGKRRDEVIVAAVAGNGTRRNIQGYNLCLLYTSDAADERSSVDLGGRRIIKKKKKSTMGVYDSY